MSDSGYRQAAPVSSDAADVVHAIEVPAQVDRAHPQGRATLDLPQSETLFAAGAEFAPKNCRHEVILQADFSAGHTKAAEERAGDGSGTGTEGNSGMRGQAAGKEEATPIALLIHNIVSPEENEFLRAQMDDGVDHKRTNGTLERHRQKLSNRRQDRAELFCERLADVLFSRIEPVLQQYGLDKYEIQCTEGDIVDNGRTLFNPETYEVESLVDVSNEGLNARFSALDAQRKPWPQPSCPHVDNAQGGVHNPLSFPAQDVPMLFPQIPDTRGGKEGDYHAVGVNERFSFMKYRPPEAGMKKGDQFLAHVDGNVHMDTRQSLFTILLYVSGEPGVEGGETNLLTRPINEDDPNTDGREDNFSVLASVKCKQRDSCEVGAAPPSEGQDKHDLNRPALWKLEPEPGSALVFFQRGLVHEGCEVLSGTKTVIRSDVMFRIQPDSYKEQADQEGDTGANLKKRWQEQKAKAWKICKEGTRLEEEGNIAAATKLYSRAYRMDDKLQKC